MDGRGKLRVTPTSLRPGAGTRRRLLSAASAVAGAAGVAAISCGQSGGGGESGAPTQRTSPATISFAHWGTESGLGVMNREAAKQFTQQYPTIKVELVFKPDDYLMHLQTMVAGGSAPDVFDISTPDFGPPAKD